jgi:hypothetical protein
MCVVGLSSLLPYSHGFTITFALICTNEGFGTFKQEYYEVFKLLNCPSYL